MIKIIIQILFVILITTTVNSQIFKTVSVEFIRTIRQNDTKELLKGNIYFTGEKFILITKSPLIQWMIIKNSNMLIYYPNEKKAIKIKSQNPISLPFFQSFLGLVEDNLGLSKLGYTISKNELHQDTLFVHWKPPKNAEKMLGEYILALKDNKIILTILKSPNGKTITQTTYKKYTNYGDQYFPLEINSITYLESNVTIESINYINPVFNKTIPKEITNFNLPKNVVVKEVQW